MLRNLSIDVIDFEFAMINEDNLIVHIEYRHWKMKYKSCKKKIYKIKKLKKNLLKKL